MAKHFISVLGTGFYSKAVYCCEEGRFTTEYVQEAILELKLSDWSEQDRITVFVTEASKKLNWMDRPYTERERMAAEKQGIVLSEYRPGLKNVLKQTYEKNLCSEENNTIPVGANEAELWEIFQNIYECIHEKDELYIDITHALRNIPVQMLAVVAYARAVKNVQVKAIYYGAFETGQINADGLVEAPIFDLITFLNILDWSQAAHSFVRHGNSELIEELVQEKMSQSNIRTRELYKTIGEIGNVTRGLETSRGYFDVAHPSNNKGGKSILESYRQYQDSFQILMKKDAKEQDDTKRQLNSIKPLKGLMEKVDEKLRIFDVDNNMDLGLAAIQWSIDNNKLQQGFTALDETLKTFLCKKYELDETLEYHREGICKAACVLLAKELRNGKLLTLDVREEAYQKWEGNEKEQDIVRRIFDTLPEDVVKLSMDISSNRNSMNHFGYSNKGQYSSTALKENLNKYYQKFIECMEQMQ